MSTSTLRLTRQQVREVDRLAIESYGLPGIVLMENAARAVTESAWELLGQRPGGSALILCGSGNNGGDGLAVGRHLHNRGVHVQIGLLGDPGAYRGDAKINYDVVRKMGLPMGQASAEWIAQQRCDLIIDALFGTGLMQSPRPPFEQIAEAVNRHPSPVLAVDLPSGLDCDTGQPLGPCIRAVRTVTFVAEKVGFAAPQAAEYTGIVTVGDIGCPRELIERVTQSV